jgi:hypothetical protein
MIIARRPKVTAAEDQTSTAAIAVAVGQKALGRLLNEDAREIPAQVQRTEQSPS